MAAKGLRGGDVMGIVTSALESREAKGGGSGVSPRSTLESLFLAWQERKGGGGGLRCLSLRQGGKQASVGLQMGMMMHWGAIR